MKLDKTYIIIGFVARQGQVDQRGFAPIHVCFATPGDKTVYTQEIGRYPQYREKVLKLTEGGFLGNRYYVSEDRPILTDCVYEVEFHEDGRIDYNLKSSFQGSEVTDSTLVADKNYFVSEVKGKG